MSFKELVENRINEVGNCACFGLDPDPLLVPDIRDNEATSASEYFSSILELAHSQDVVPAFVKPNLGFWGAMGIRGLTSLRVLIGKVQQLGIPVILDGKFGDIGKSSAMYAKMAFESFEADATTVAPYMGKDSILPFASHNKGVFVLARTSNLGSEDLQQVKTKDSDPLWHQTIHKVLSWESRDIGFVVGATDLKDLEESFNLILDKQTYCPILIPGVGSQGGSARDVLELAKRLEYPTNQLVINSSSSVAYAYQRSKRPVDPILSADAALGEFIRETSV